MFEGNQRRWSILHLASYDRSGLPAIEGRTKCEICARRCSSAEGQGQGTTYSTDNRHTVKSLSLLHNIPYFMKNLKLDGLFNITISPKPVFW